MSRKFVYTIMVSAVYAFLPINSVQAEDSAMQGVKLGFAFDQGFGVTGSLKNFNGFVGNDGFAIDYIFHKEPLKLEAPGQMFWYIGAGGYHDWDSDTGVRVPIGAEWDFAKSLDAYAQIIPGARVNNDAEFNLDAAIGIRYQF